MCISIHLFSFHVYVQTFSSCSSLCAPFNLSFACLISLYLPPSFPLHSLKKKKNVFSLFLLDSTFFPLCPCLGLLLSVSQTRIPGTLIPLCAAQCERIFNTTRTPGEETGKETDMYTHKDTHTVAM